MLTLKYYFAINFKRSNRPKKKSEIQNYHRFTNFVLVNISIWNGVAQQIGTNLLENISESFVYSIAHLIVECQFVFAPCALRTDMSDGGQLLNHSLLSAFAVINTNSPIFCCCCCFLGFMKNFAQNAFESYFFSSKDADIH